jgi:hypothetical protein
VSHILLLELAVAFELKYVSHTLDITFNVEERCYCEDDEMTQEIPLWKPLHDPNDKLIVIREFLAKFHPNVKPYKLTLKVLRWVAGVLGLRRYASLTSTKLATKIANKIREGV